MLIDVSNTDSIDVQQEALASDRPSEGPGLMGDVADFLAEIPDTASSPGPSSQYEAAYPEPIARLKERITTLRRDAGKTRKAFKDVEKVIEEMELTDGQREELVRLWQKEFKGFEEKLHSSKQVAIQAHGTIEDFLKTIVPYLEDRKHSVDRKVELLAQYRDTVTEGRNRALDISKSFSDMRNGIKVFKELFNSYSTEADNQMTAVMDELQRQINQLSNSWQTVIRSFLSVFNGIQDELQVTEPNEDVVVPDGQGIGELKRDLSEYRRRRREAADQNVAVTKKTGELIQLAGNFGAIWNSIEVIVIDIETKLLKISGPPTQVFYTRLSNLPGQYRGLMEALDLYAAALSERVEKHTFISRLKKLIPGSK